MEAACRQSDEDSAGLLLFLAISNWQLAISNEPGRSVPELFADRQSLIADR
jgi:hypothetical protein